MPDPRRPFAPLADDQEESVYPYAGVNRSTDAPSAADAAAILSQHFGLGATAPLALARARGSEISELQDRLPNEEGAAMIPMEGFVPGEPGRRYVSQLPLSNMITDRARLRQLEHDESADPYTGDAAQEQTQHVQDALDAAATTQRTEIGDAARTTAQRNAFAEYMKRRGLKIGEYEAAASPAARAAQQVPIEAQLSNAAQALKDSDLDRKGREKMQQQVVPGQIPDGKGGFTDAPVRTPPGAAETNILRSIDNTYSVVGDLKSLLDPTNNQIIDSATKRAMYGLYKAGIDPALFGADPQTRKRFQLASLVQVLGSTPYANQSRNYAFIQDVRQHLTNPLATDQFLYGQIQELEKRLPEFRDTLERVHRYPWTKPPGMESPAVGTPDATAEPGELNATIRSDTRAPGTSLPSKYAPPTVEEQGVDNVIRHAEETLRRPQPPRR